MNYKPEVCEQLIKEEIIKTLSFLFFNNLVSIKLINLTKLL